MSGFSPQGETLWGILGGNRRNLEDPSAVGDTRRNHLLTYLSVGGICFICASPLPAPFGVAVDLTLITRLWGEGIVIHFPTGRWLWASSAHAHSRNTVPTVEGKQRWFLLELADGGAGVLVKPGPSLVTFSPWLFVHWVIGWFWEQHWSPRCLASNSQFPGLTDFFLLSLKAPFCIFICPFTSQITCGRCFAVLLGRKRGVETREEQRMRETMWLWRFNKNALFLWNRLHMREKGVRHHCSVPCPLPA